MVETLDHPAPRTRLRTPESPLELLGSAPDELHRPKVCCRQDRDSASQPDPDDARCKRNMHSRAMQGSAEIADVPTNLQFDFAARNEVL